MIIIRTPQTKDEFKHYYALRYHVLRQPIGQPKGSEKDDYEPISQHFIAVDDQSGEIVGAVKLMEKEPGVGQFSHMAVLEKYQRKGVGKMLMEAVEDAARQHGYKKLGIMTRVTATNYYEKSGFKITGLPSPMFGNMNFVWMEKTL